MKRSVYEQEQGRHAAGSEAPSPFNDHRLRHLQAFLDLFVPLALGRQQRNAGAQNIALGGGRRTYNAFQTYSLFAPVRSGGLYVA
jgi:hypothetical protein